MKNFNTATVSFFFKMIEDILKLEGTMRVGHRLGVVTVFVKETTSPDIQDKIRMLLYQHSIYLFDILMVSKINELHYACCVGSKLSNTETHGTVGAFAEGSAGGTRKYVLLSAHVANAMLLGTAVYLAGHEINFSLSDVHKCEKPVHDIAAFLINRDIEDKYHLDGRFKTEEGMHRPCRVPSFHSSSKRQGKESLHIDELIGAEVYIRGATTELGKGKIVSVDMFDASKTPIILVEDRERGIQFSGPMDSGAVVCYDNADEGYIDAIAMTQGQYTAKSNSDSKFDVNRYCILTLHECLKELSSRCGRICLYDKEFGQM